MSAPCVFRWSVLLSTLVAVSWWVDRAKSAETLAVASASSPGATSDWPRWRGPLNNGVSADASAPTAWSPTEHVVWKVTVPGRGHASPTICGNQVFIATADDGAQEQRLLCYDRSSGKELWNTLIHSGGFLKMHPKNSHASPTPACDGERVYVPFINADAQWITAVNLDGKIAWQQKVGPFNSEHGDGPSPVLYKDRVILNSDGLGDSCITALDRETGKVVWSTPRKGPGRHANYGSPAIAEVGGRVQLLLTGHGRTDSYNPDNGELLWTCQGPAEVAGNTVAANADLVFASAGYPEHEVIAIRADGSGDVTESHVAWRSRRAPAYVPSPLCCDGRLYVVSDQGVVTCYHAQDGEQLWQHRLGGAFSASPVMAGGNVYVASEKGVVTIFHAGDQYQEIAAVDMGEEIMATPAVCGGQLFLRTAGNLYCIGR